MERLEDERIPLILEGGEEGGDGGELGRTRLGQAALLEVYEVVGGELLAIDGVGAVLSDVSFNEPLFEDVAYTYRKSANRLWLRCFVSLTGLARCDWLLGRFAGDWEGRSVMESSLHHTSIDGRTCAQHLTGGCEDT